MGGLLRRRAGPAGHHRGDGPRGGQGGGALALLPAARASGATLWTDLRDYDGVAEFHRPFAEACWFVFLNDDGARDHRALMEDLLARGASTVVCTRGARGAVALTAEGWADCPAEPADVVDTNGAGDAFFSGFLA